MSRMASGNEQPMDAEKRFLTELRLMVSGETVRPVPPEKFLRAFDPAFSQTYITLFQKGQKSLRWGAKRTTLQESLSRAVEGLRRCSRFGDFDVADVSACRIMVEMVTESYACDLQKMTNTRFSRDRFEPGVMGLRCERDGKLYYFMPTDAVTHSIMSVTQLLNHLSKRFGIASQTPKVSERVAMMRALNARWSFLKSIAVISFLEESLALYRGIPVPVTLSVQNIGTSLRNSVTWLADNMKSDGRFLYYYDPLKDSEVDFQHPKMTNPTYYNILRHCGGTITLLMGYERFGDAHLLAAARRSLDYFVTTLKTHSVEGKYACFPFYNRKSKLGGAGIGLVAVMHYMRLAGDGRYGKYAEGLVRHILSRIEPDGEMIGYYLHPGFRNGAPLTGVTDEEKRGLFSFYYPGEALLGLALYYRYAETMPGEMRETLLQKSRQALDFLIHIRPVKYRELFEPLPADSWLMQAIEVWDAIAPIVTDAHRDFVYGDAQKMMQHMYVPKNAPFPDYVGGFFYHYGDHVYHDGSRCEGLMAAHYLAKQRGEKDKASKILNHLLLSAKGLLHLYNSPESAYAHRFAERTVGSFRFKLTRQWVRVDSVQHTACFFARLQPLLQREPT